MKKPDQLGKLLAGILGLFLAVFMTVEVSHSHPAASADASASTHCQICATAHVAIASQPSSLGGNVLLAIDTISIGEPSQGSRTVVLTAFIRPPPAASAIA